MMNKKLKLENLKLKEENKKLRDKLNEITMIIEDYGRSPNCWRPKKAGFYVVCSDGVYWCDY